MSTVLKALAFAAIGTVALIGNPEKLSIAPAQASATQLICTSTNFQYSYCGAGVGRGRVDMVDQLSRAPCQQGRSWGYDPRGIWVTNGCAARFAFQGGGSGGNAVGAAIVGGLIGAMLGSAASDHGSHATYNYYERSDRYSRPYPVAVDRRRDTSQDTDYSVQKFDKDGNPNYDADGNYQGAHGVGALVDNPDSGSSDRSDTNPDGSGGPN